MKNRYACFLCIFVLILFLFIGCSNSDSNSTYYYNFNNLTEYTVFVTVNHSYRISGQENNELISKNSRIMLHSNNSVSENNKVSITVTHSGVLDFKWTTDNEEDNKKIYCTVNKNSAVFRER